jgi:xanthine dehydrogenase YagT iron-sulfur-binding subunit
MLTVFDGRPRVLALLRAWDARTAAPAELDAMRAQLRGLGATMTIASETGAWTFAPDDELERASGADAPVVSALVELAQQHGLQAGDEAVFVVDGDGEVRFAHVEDGVLQTSLSAALASAGEAVLAAPEARTLFTRREWALASLCAGFSLALLGCKSKPTKHQEPAPVATTPAPDEYDVVLDVNGKERPLRLDPRVSLLDALRERLALPGTKKGCDHGQCGSCTVHVDGKRQLACMSFAVAMQGKRIMTIEGLASGNELHPMQQAFIEHDGLQCGYCTPGQIMSAVALLAEGRAKTDDDVRELMSGNICRCGAYPNIVAAVQAVRRRA